MKYRVLAVALAAIAFAGSATAQDTSTEKGKVSYAMGYMLGQDVVAVGETLDAAAVTKGLNDALAKKQPSVPADQLRTAMQGYQTRVEAREKAEYDKAAASNLAESNKFLATNKAKPGVVSLPSGVQYRVITAGKGTKPTNNSTVNLRMAGPFPLGTRAEQAERNAARPMNDVKVSDIPLAGLRQALTAMPVGSKWEVTLPPALAFGADPRTGQPPNVALQFEVELVSAK